MVEPDSLVLEHVRPIRGEMAKLVTQNHDHVEIRLDRIEKRPDLVE